MAVLPEYFRPILEFQKIMEVHENSLNVFEKNADQVWKNLFIQTCDEATISLYENRFGIIPIPGDTLEYRRKRLLQKYNTITPFSIEFLKSRLTVMYGDDYSLVMDPVACKLTISVTSDRYGAIDMLYDLLWDVIPAHLEVVSNQQVTNFVSGSIYACEIMAGTCIQTI